MFKLQLPSNSATIYVVTTIVAIAGFLFGFNTGIISGALFYIHQTFVLTTTLKEMVVSSMLFGAVVGSMLSGRLTDYFGRRGILFAIVVVLTLGTWVAVAAQSVTSLMMGRVIIGIGIGISSYSAPLYIAEVAPSEKRGALVTFNQLAITLGILISYFVDYTFSAEGAWQLMFATGFMPTLLLGVGVLFLPESPRWLVMRGRLDEAKNVLKALRHSSNVDSEISEIQSTLNVKHAKFKDLFAKWLLPVVVLGVVMSCLQQVTGINVIIFYAPIIFHKVGFASNASAILATVGLGIINVIATLISIRFIDKLGRRPLLLSGIAGMGISLFVLAVMFHVGLHETTRWLAIASLFLYISCFAYSLGGILWLLLSEIFPLEVRGVAMSVAVAACWFWNIVVSSTFLTLFNTFGSVDTFMLYSLMCVIALVICYRFVPETRNCSLETIEKNIRDGLPLRQIGQPLEDTSGALGIRH